MPQGPPCCDFNSDAGHPYRTDPPHRWRDPVFGFEFKLCDRHYEAVTTKLPKVLRNTPSRFVMARPWGRRNAKRRILAAGNHADGDRDAAGAAGDADGA